MTSTECTVPYKCVFNVQLLPTRTRPRITSCTRLYMYMYMSINITSCTCLHYILYISALHNVHVYMPTRITSCAHLSFCVTSCAHVCPTVHTCLSRPNILILPFQQPKSLKQATSPTSSERKFLPPKTFSSEDFFLQDDL